ncbi:MAG TPA: class I SAM-dependent methyltransferase [Terracidiphilus sp.]|nr:class I SAM-dependent methyltransferase [Terracidiphilus sp.]
MNAELPGFEPTFRDPAGQLILTEQYALRRVRPPAASAAKRFLDSPLRARLEASGDLVSSEIVASELADPSERGAVTPDEQGGFWLRHPRINPINYPWEWTPAQSRAAAELTLGIAGKAIDAGWTLKDATPLNVVFDGARAVFVDVLSFEPRNPHSTVWLAYGQFVRSFLLPLVAAKYLNWPLQTTLFWRDGYEPAVLARALPLRHRIKPILLDVVTLAAMLEGKSGAKARPAEAKTEPDLAKHILHKRLARLTKQIAHAAGDRKASEWSSYNQSASHYQPADVAAKQAFVRAVLERLRPAQVLDIGANTGSYSLVAAEAGAKVVALDNDTAALEVLFRAAAEQKKPVTAMVANIARPTPAAGWRNREQLSLLDRLRGRFDLVLMLAVIHHLILREQAPLTHIAGLAAELTRRWLVIEWVPPSDPMYQEWLRGRDDLYGHLCEADLIGALAPLFTQNDRTELGNGRVLLLLERHNSPGQAGGKRNISQMGAHSG